MATVPMAHGLLFAGLLFVLGVLGLLVRRNVVFVPSGTSATLDAIGAAQTFGATARDANGNVVPNATFVWSSSARKVSISPNTLAVSASVSGVGAIKAPCGAAST